MTPSTEVNPMFEQAVCFAFTLTCPGTSRKVSTEQIETDADKALLTISKQILQSKEYDAIEPHDEQTRDYLRRRALPFPFKRGIYLLPIALIAQVEAQLDACDVARQVLIRQALDAYPRLIEEVRGRLGSLFNAADYPPVSQLANTCSRDIQYLTLTVPGSLKAVSQAVFERERVQRGFSEVKATLDRLPPARASRRIRFEEDEVA